jgi:hypothetical protein
MMNSKTQKFLTRFFMLALVALFALPLAAFALGNGRGGRGKPTDVFVNGHDARDGRWDKNNGQGVRDQNRNRDNDELRRRRAAEEAQRQREIETARRQEELRRQQAERNRNNDDWRRRNDDNNDPKPAWE